MPITTTIYRRQNLGRVTAGTSARSSECVRLVKKTTYQLRPGDVVHMGGGRFLVESDLVLSNAHPVEGYWPADPIGPTDCVRATGRCLSGMSPGLFAPGYPWTFQGNHLATWCVEA